MSLEPRLLSGTKTCCSNLFSFTLRYSRENTAPCSYGLYHLHKLHCQREDSSHYMSKNYEDDLITLQKILHKRVLMTSKDFGLHLMKKTFLIFFNVLHTHTFGRSVNPMKTPEWHFKMICIKDSQDSKRSHLYWTQTGWKYIL